MKKSAVFAILLTGITAVSGQIILIREFFTAFYGNELSVGFILALWLVGGAVGSGVAGVAFVGKIRRKVFVFAFGQVALSVLLPLSIVFARIFRTAFGLGMGEIVGLPIFLACSALALLPIAALLGFLFVLACSIFTDSRQAVGIGRVYTLEAIGAMAGGILTSLVLIRFFGSLQIAFMLSFVNLVSALFLMRAGRGVSRMRRTVLAVAPAVLLSALMVFTVFGGIKFLDGKSLEIKWKGFNVLESKDSIYGRTTVTGKDGQFNFFENGLFLFSSRDPLTAEMATHFALALSPHPKKILLIGGGASEITNEILKHPVESVDYVELNPAIIALSEKFFHKEPFCRFRDARVNVINTDARFFIKNTDTRYDLIIMHMPNPCTARINRFYTKEFFGEAKHVLTKSGIVTFGVTSSENYISKEQALFLKTIFETAKTEFSEVKIIPGDVAHFLLSNKKGTLSLDYETIMSHLRSRGVKTTYVREYYLSSMLSASRQSNLYSAIRSAGKVRVNLDFYPVSYFYDMVLWSTYFSFGISKFFILFTAGRLLLLTSFAFVIVFLAILAGQRSKNFRKNVTLLSLCTTGLSEISFEILIVLAFQIIYGYLYYMLGIIVTSFMLGLAMGSLYITRRLAKISRPFKTYIKVQALVCAYPLLLLGCFWIFSRLSASHAANRIGVNLFSILPFIAGFVGGIQYPLANKICLEPVPCRGEKSPPSRQGIKPESPARNALAVGKIAGTTYAVDLFGSFIGAFVLCSFFIPIVGIPMTCLLVTALNGVSLALLLIARARRPVPCRGGS